MRVGIFFGGRSREREVSFAGGRTVYDNLNKGLFQPVPIFVDTLGNFIHLDWKNIYKGTIRDFYPTASAVSESLPDQSSFQLYVESLHHLPQDKMDKMIAEVGEKVAIEELASLIDFAFLTFHGPYGEDGNIQGILEWCGIPYSGAGMFSSAFGINKLIQANIMSTVGFLQPKRTSILRSEWETITDRSKLLRQLISAVGSEFVIKAPTQGSSIGVAILSHPELTTFEAAVDRCFFKQQIDITAFQLLDSEQKRIFVHRLIDIREGLGLPLYHESADRWILHPAELYDYLSDCNEPSIVLSAQDADQQLLVEEKISGKEFSCIVIEDEQGKPLSLPPTEIRKKTDLFDYKSKYLPGMSRKITPIDASDADIRKITKACEDLFELMQAEVYARIDGFLSPEGHVYLNDPNTTSGMMPSSFFFHQAAEVDMDPSAFITYIIRTSLAARLKTGKNQFSIKRLLAKLDDDIHRIKHEESDAIKVAVVMGGFSSERHISVESGRNIFEKLNSSPKYQAIPVFLSGDEEMHRLFRIPVKVMLKDNADDIKEKAFHGSSSHPIVKEIAQKADQFLSRYRDAKSSIQLQELSYDELARAVDFAFIALHGRPGEDGAIQRELEKRGVPYNGSSIESSQLTIDKYATNQFLRENGFKVADHMLIQKEDFLSDSDELIRKIEQAFAYPMIAKPSDDGCSSAVKKIKNQEELNAFTRLMFRDEEMRDAELEQTLRLAPTEEFPRKSYFLVEELIDKKDALYFLEITGGLLTHRQDDGSVRYEIFRPSEALASGDVLSLEEKFLAGEGQNITPARYAPTAALNEAVEREVQKVLHKVAETLKIEGYARIDAFVKVDQQESVHVYIIEINSLPGMTPATCIFHQCALNAYTPYDFVDAIIDYGFKKMKINA
ncbi:MAG: D-alanine--D-alanine ligase [Cyclobacteriaceae bacterium]|nr:D-alanine--D-alanine ligase [Cyclobacteriaceae bacterium]MCH8517151.1 D-alanine--D-alanine ligase [Cyclobacteriaceae bacterium]